MVITASSVGSRAKPVGKLPPPHALDQQLPGRSVSAPMHRLFLPIIYLLALVVPFVVSNWCTSKSDSGTHTLASDCPLSTATCTLTLGGSSYSWNKFSICVSSQLTIAGDSVTTLRTISRASTSNDHGFFALEDTASSQSTHILLSTLVPKLICKGM